MANSRLGALFSVTCGVLLLVGCSAEAGSGGAAADDAAPHRGPASAPLATAAPTATPPVGAGDVSPHPYVGMWVTADGHIRQMLLPNGRYDEARGERESAYTGSYQVVGTRIEYVDDTGFSADGTFGGDVLHHAGYVFYRAGSDAHRQAREGR
ncbi:Atu4866 domain-containing protein [Micromonospora sp. NPDC049891]|uniref:Atu4866 domain-containing protein n=1 Tax=Micromonospora sp. NPDC049891 TaxID=3155655 RepID=UPI0033F22634